MEISSEKPLVCPYCGAIQAQSGSCRECGGVFEPLSRRATQIAMGPWFIRDERRPYRPGCSYDVLTKHIKAGRVKITTVIRGPTTRQFWAPAGNVPGVAHLLGLCHQCGEHVSPEAARCRKCSAIFNAVPHRNELGLQFSTEETAQAAQVQLEKDIETANKTAATRVVVTGAFAEPAPRTASAVNDALLSIEQARQSLLNSTGPGSVAAETSPIRAQPVGPRLIRFAGISLSPSIWLLILTNILFLIVIGILIVNAVQSSR